MGLTLVGRFAYNCSVARQFCWPLKLDIFFGCLAKVSLIAHKLLQPKPPKKFLFKLTE